MRIISLFLLVLIVSCSGNINSVESDPIKQDSAYNKSFNTNQLLNSVEDFDYILEPYNVFDYLGNNPHNVTRSYVDGVQGLANDGVNWYLSNKEEIYKWNGSAGFPSSITSTSNYGYTGNVINQGYNHYGDIDFDDDQNLLYVPMEKTNKTLDPLLLVLNSDLELIDSATLTKNTQSTKEAPWVSIDPISKKIFTSKFNNVSELWIYTDLDTGTGLDLDPTVEVLQLKNELGQTISLNGVQGGEFSKSGHLFLLVQDGCNDDEGIYIFDINTGRLLNFQDEVKCTGSSQEFEGITIWDLDNDSNNGGISGQVHALNYEDHWYYGKKFWLKHLRLTQYTEVVTPRISGQIINNKVQISWDDFGTGYSYRIYEEKLGPDYGITQIGNTSNNSISSNTILNNPFGNGSYYPIRYTLYAYKNGGVSLKSNTLEFMYEYVNTDPDPLPCIFDPCPGPGPIE